MSNLDLDAQDLEDIKATGSALQRAISTGSNMKGTCLPKPPKKGELMYCQHCGQPMLPKDFSKNPTVRKQEFKWQIHYRCQQTMLDLCDRSTPGLAVERKQKERRNG